MISLISRDRGNASPRNVEVSDFATTVSTDDSSELPEGLASVGFILFVDCYIFRSSPISLSI